MLNAILIHGRLVRDPEIRKTQSDVSVCNFTVAVDRYFKSGEEKQTDFFDVVAWRGLAEMISKHFSKGKEIMVSGEMHSRKWVDNDGANRIAWEIQAANVDFCGSKNDQTTQNVKNNSVENITNSENTDGLEVIEENEDLPF